jgi:hypothetical protein
MLFVRLKSFINTVLATVLVTALLIFTQCLQISRFSEIEGKRTFYLQSPSSQAVVKETIAPWEIFEVEGESVSFVCVDREKTLKNILQSYGATVLFQERAGDSISYYCVTEKWPDGMEIGGVFVNLHIAFNGKNCAVGTPIIFGGF